MSLAAKTIVKMLISHIRVWDIKVLTLSPNSCFLPTQTLEATLMTQVTSFLLPKRIEFLDGVLGAGLQP